MGMDYHVYVGPCILIKEKPDGFDLREFAAETCEERLSVDDSDDGTEFLLDNQEGAAGDTWYETCSQSPLLKPDIVAEIERFSQRLTATGDLNRLTLEGVKFEVTWAVYGYYS